MLINTIASSLSSEFNSFVCLLNFIALIHIYLAISFLIGYSEQRRNNVRIWCIVDEEHNDQDVGYSFIFIDKAIQKMTLKKLIILNADWCRQKNWERSWNILDISWWQYSMAYMFIHRQEKFCYHMLFIISSLCCIALIDTVKLCYIFDCWYLLFYISHHSVNHSLNINQQSSIIILHISIVWSSVLSPSHFK